METGIIDEFSRIVAIQKMYWDEILIWMGVLWLVNISHFLLGKYGIIVALRPRKINGLPGILLSWAFHGNFSHLFHNSFTLFPILLIVISLHSLNELIIISVIIAILEGSLVWLFARSANHIGASGVIMGLFGFILTEAYSSPSPIHIIIAIAMLYYFGALLFSIIPSNDQSSWESHLFGLIGGVITCLTYKQPEVQTWLKYILPYAY